MNTYLIVLPQGVNSTQQQFQEYFNGTTEKVQLQPGLFLVRSPRALTDWYQAVGNVTAAPQGSIGNHTPLVLPVTLDQLRGIPQLPGILTEFLNRYSRAA